MSIYQPIQNRARMCKYLRWCYFFVLKISGVLQESKGHVSEVGGSG